MARRWFGCLAALIGCAVFCFFYQQWFSWFLLIGVALLPLLSLIISLPALLTVQASLQIPSQAELNSPAAAQLRLFCPLPEPPVRCRLLVKNAITGASARYALGEQLATEHCGLLQISVEGGYFYDYLGLFRRPLRVAAESTLLVLPKPVAVEEPPQLRQYLANAWRPKRGGGFSETHELRLYRPGDDLRQIHWKLAAKTGKLIVREPMEALRGGAALSLVLSGSEAQMDEKLGKLLALSRTLLENHLPHTLCCLTGSGMKQFFVTDEAVLKAAMKTVLSSPMAPAGATLPQTGDWAWHYRIGGETHES